MSVQVEKLEHSMVKLTVTVPAAQFTAACKTAYNKQKNQFNVPGFRKGKVPQAMIEKMYGPEVFFDEAANICMNETYGPALDEAGIVPQSRPTADIVEIGKGKDMVYTVEVAVNPEVTLGQYKGVEVTEGDLVVTEDEVESRIAGEQKRQARKTQVTDRAVEEGDKINLNYAGTVDGVAFDGGTAEKYDLKIGSGDFIPGFEDQLIGVMPGEDKNVEVTFPEDYHAAELAGKAAVFACNVNYIEVEELPELDDEFAQDISEFDTFEEYKADVKAKLEVEKAAQVKATQTDEAVNKIVEASEMDIADAMIDAMAEQMIDEFKQQLNASGMSFEQYVQYTGQTMDVLKEQVKPEAIKRIQQTAVLGAIAKAEGIEVTDEEVEAEIEKMANQYGLPVEQIKAYFNVDNMKNDMLPQKAADFVAENMVIVAAPAEA